MGIFNRYLKEGPGIDKNAPKKKGIFLYAELIGRKFFDLLKANAMFSLVSIPFFALALFVLAPFVRSVFVPQSLLDGGRMQVMFDVFFAGFIFTFFGSGPASAAYAFVTRSFTKSEHVWIVSDGFDAFKENFKNSMLIVVIDAFAIVLAMNAIAFYGMNTNTGFVFLRFFIMFLFAVFAMSHMFIYQIMVTYECKFRDIVKYSLLMTIAKLPICVLLSVIAGAVWVLLWYFLGIPGCVIYLILGLSFARYPFEFYTSRVVAKNIAKTNANDSKKEDEE